jgi:hypothetical protein
MYVRRWVAVTAVTGCLVALLGASSCESEPWTAWMPAAVAPPNVKIGVTLEPAHAYLAEYHRWLEIELPHGRSRVDLQIDSGGYARINVYRVGAQDVLVRPLLADDYHVAAVDGRVTVRPRGNVLDIGAPPDSTYLGSFDILEDRSWEFLTPDDKRPRRYHPNLDQ